MTPQLEYGGSFNGDPDVGGGPMFIGEGYRWNVPVVTYGFDQSFLDYFGSNGVAAIESAIQTFNNIPPASTINLNAYPFDTSHINERANFEGIVDLKSTALNLILEQMGLISPTRYMFSLYSFTDFDNYTLLMLNFDPETLAPSTNINAVAYFPDFLVWDDTNHAAVDADPVDIYQPWFTAVTDLFESGDSDGMYYNGLTYDDVGGLCYLLSTNNVAPENLLPGVRGRGTNACNFVRTALRPGVDKITFQPHNLDTHSGQFAVMTNQYTDYYYTNGVLLHQDVERVISAPDILFTAKFAGLSTTSLSGTTNWQNNGLPGHAGPGVIRPPVSINFADVGPNLIHYETSSVYPDPARFMNSWGSYDGTTNEPILYPINAPATNSTAVHLMLEPPTFDPAGERRFSWNQAGLPNEVFLLQTSTDLSNWTTSANITNVGREFLYIDQYSTTLPQRFFRVVPQ